MNEARWPLGLVMTAFTSQGQAQVKNGRVDFVTSYPVSPPLVDNRTGSTAGVDAGSSWGLTGSSWADAGPHNSDFGKPK